MLISAEVTGVKFPFETRAAVRIAILYPHFVHAAIEERYGSWQSQLFLRRAAPGAEWVTYDPDADICVAARDIAADYCIVVTDPLLLCGTALLDCLAAALAGGVVAAIPVTNEGTQGAQIAGEIEPYLTIRQFKETAGDRATRNEPAKVVVWSGDPGLYLAPAAFVRNAQSTAAEALNGRNVAISPNAYVHRWTRLRSQARTDLLPRIPDSVQSILEFGCAEGILGQAVKARQPCRFVGIEIDPEAAEKAGLRLDHVYCGNAEEIVSTLAEGFDCILGGDVLEHLADPWSFLTGLRKLANEEALLLLSIPNVANWAIIADLLRGTFDYAYIAIACAGHLRFFGRETITDALEIAGWSVESIEPQTPIVNSETFLLLKQLSEAGIPHDPDALLAPGFYVRARALSQAGG